MFKIIAKTVAVCMIGLLCTGTIALAAGNAKIIQKSMGEDSISVYVRGIEGDIASVECQIGTTAGQEVAFYKLSDRETPAKTLIMLDNSLSIPNASRPAINSLLTQFIEDKTEKEQVAIAVFGEDISYLSEYTTDGTALKKVIESIEYEDKETYTTDVLYDVVTNENMGDDNCFERILIISDGVDNKSLGYTKEELYTLLKERSLPIYTVGCINQNNNEQLENMFALSRITSAESFLLDETEDLSEVTERMAQDYDIVCFQITPYSDEMDGSTKGLRISVNTGNATQTVDTTVTMPLKAGQSKEAEEESIAAAVLPIEPAAAEPTEEEPVSEEQKGLPAAVWIAAAVLLAGAAAAGIIIMLKVKTGKRSGGFATYPHVGDYRVEDPIADSGSDTVLLRDTDSMNTQTERLIPQDMRKYTIILTDVVNQARSFQKPMNNSIIIGRKAGISDIALDYDDAVSGKHCEIIARERKFFVRDVGSHNGTYVNDSRVLGEMEIYSGSILRLGRTKLRVEFR